LPDTWANGQITGLKARGGFVIDMNWQYSQLTTAQIHSEKGGDCTLRIRTPVTVTQNGKTLPVKESENGVINFPTVAGQQYQITPR